MRFGILTLVLAGFVALGLSSLTGCSPESEATVAEVKLPTIQCDSCVKTVTTALKGVKGVKEVSVDLEKKQARVTYSRNQTNLAQIELAVARAGYAANSTRADPNAYAKLPACCKVPESK